MKPMSFNNEVWLTCTSLQSKGNIFADSSQQPWGEDGLSSGLTPQHMMQLQAQQRQILLMQQRAASTQSPQMPIGNGNLNMASLNEYQLALQKQQQQQQQQQRQQIQSHKSAVAAQQYQMQQQLQQQLMQRSRSSSKDEDARAAAGSHAQLLGKIAKPDAAGAEEKKARNSQSKGARAGRQTSLKVIKFGYRPRIP